jgi:hypothetical protein
MKNISNWLVFAVIVISIGIRLTVYGNLKLSVATRDTQSYIDSSEVDLLSWEAFTSYRPYTTNVVYKIFAPLSGYQIRAISDGDSGTVKRQIDVGAEDIAVLQSTASIIAWACLAWFFSSRLKTRAIKVLSATIIMLFGFTPQITDWDSVLSSESLSVSLFIFSYAILIWLAFAYNEELTNNVKKIAAFIAFFAALFFWVFTRDVNTYSLVFLVLFILGLYVIPRFRKTKFLLIASLIIFSLAVFGSISARQRALWKLALTHVWISDILPSPGNVQYFTERGMPEYESPGYSEWFNKHAPTTYMQFLISHPVYTTHKFFRDQDRTFEENMQPHFKANELGSRSVLILIGNYIHPKSGATFFVTLVLLLTLWSQSLFQKNQEALPWIWLLTWAFLVTTGTMFFSIFGDSWGLVRHAFSSTTTYRLLMWMLIIILADFSMVRKHTGLAEKRLNESS